MENSIVRVEHLSHRYSVHWAIKDISFEIAENGVVGLLGSNGAGKSTTMNIICGVLNQTEGNVFINGINLREDSVEAKKYIGFLPQQPPLYTDLTVGEYLKHSAFLRLMPAEEVPRAVERALERCAITHFRDRLIKNLSGGYQQRVGIAQAIIHRPDFVVLDEPTNGLDPNQILEIRHLIKAIAEECTVVLSTHILSEVQATCNYIRMIGQGTLVFSGTVDEFDNYILPNTVFATLVAAPPIEELKQLPGVVDVDELGGSNYRLRFSDSPQEMIERVVQTSVAKDWRLTEVRLEKSSLDDIFAELSKIKK